MGGVDGERLFPWPFASKEEGGRKRPAGRHPAAHHCKLKGVRQHIALADGGGKRLPLQPWLAVFLLLPRLVGHGAISLRGDRKRRSEEHTSELQSLMRSSYAVFCLKQKNITH